MDENRICMLAYADDVVLMAEGEEEMRYMIRRLEKYFEEKKIEVNDEVQGRGRKKESDGMEI